MDESVHNPPPPPPEGPTRPEGPPDREGTPDSGRRQPGPAAEGKRLTFRDRVLAEAVRVAEGTETGRKGVNAATRAGRNAGGDFEHRIATRAGAMPDAQKLSDALGQVGTATAVVVMVGLILSAIAGGAAAATALRSADQEPVNAFWVLGSLLGVQTLLLLAWVIVMVIPNASQTMAVASLGGIALGLGRKASRWVNRGVYHAAAIEATIATQAGGGAGRGRSIGRWTFSAISHGLWLSFNVGAMALLVTLLTVRQYAFSWETTILTADSYVKLTRGLAWLPDAAGIDTPDEVQIRATRGPGMNGAMREASDAWSGLIVGCMLFYGVAPRLLLLAFSLGERRAACRKYRLDTSRPEFLLLRPLLMPGTASIGVVGKPADGVGVGFRPDETPSRAGPPRRPLGPPAIVGVELPRAPEQWPPRLPNAGLNTNDWWDLGLADGRDDRLRILAELAGSGTEPSALITVCALTTTPDRGVAAFLSDLAGALNQPPILLLTAGDALRRRVASSDVGERVADWVDAASRASFDPDRVIELDLDNVTAVSAAGLAELLGDGESDASPVRRIEPAFGLIVRHVEDWGSSAGENAQGPTAKKQAELHRELADLYRNEQPRWRDLLHGSSGALEKFAKRLKSDDVREQLKAGGERMIRLLPPRLKSSSRWLAAGATAGALGCVAAATFITPIAIGALPIWTGLGAAIGGAASLGSVGKNADNSSLQDADAACGFADAIRAATLFTILLEAQGRGEAAITRILDASIPDEPDADTPEPDTPRAAREWLNDVRHRFDLALALEAGS